MFFVTKENESLVKQNRWRQKFSQGGRLIIMLYFEFLGPTDETKHCFSS